VFSSLLVLLKGVFGFFEMSLGVQFLFFHFFPFPFFYVFLVFLKSGRFASCLGTIFFVSLSCLWVANGTYVPNFWFTGSQARGAPLSTFFGYN